jgi:hypothetical protein
LRYFTIVVHHQYNISNCRQELEERDEGIFVRSRERNSSKWFSEMFSPEKVTINASV